MNCYFSVSDNDNNHKTDLNLISAVYLQIVIRIAGEVIRFKESKRKNETRRKRYICPTSNLTGVPMVTSKECLVEYLCFENCF